MDGNEHGRGKLWFPFNVKDGLIKYDVYWEKSIKEGQGTLVCPNGTYYVGGFRVGSEYEAGKVNISKRCTMHRQI